MPALMMVCAVHRNERVRSQDLNHRALLFAAPVPAGVDLRMCVARDDLQPATLESIDYAQHAELVSRNDARREDHGVSRFDLQARVFVAR